MSIYTNDNYEIVKIQANDGVRYGVKPIGVKGFDYISKDLDKAISQADYYNTLPLVRTSDIVMYEEESS